MREPVPPAFQVAGVSRKGRRPSNEDSAVWALGPHGSALRAYAVVCDGMGGHNSGEVASAMASEMLVRRMDALGGEAAAAPADLEGRLLSWVAEVNLAIYEGSQNEVKNRGMGTTLALALVVGEKRLLVANVGDSRVFLVRGLQVTQLSVDHTALAERRKALGQDSILDEAVPGPFAHALTRSLGQETTVHPDLRSDVELEDGDVVILTSDGVTDVLESERFLRAIEGSHSLDEAAEAIYSLAFEGGSRDNITVALLSHGRPARLGTAPEPTPPSEPTRTVPVVRKNVLPQTRKRATSVAIAGALVAGAGALVLTRMTSRPGTIVTAAAPTPAAAALPPLAPLPRAASESVAPAASSSPAAAVAAGPSPTAPPGAAVPRIALAAPSTPTVPALTPTARPTQIVPLRRDTPAKPETAPAAEDATPGAVRDAALVSSRLRVLPERYQIELAFREDGRLPETQTATAGSLHLVEGDVALLADTEAQPLTCAASRNVVTCTFPRTKLEERLQRPLRSGDAVRFRLWLGERDLNGTASVAE